MKQIVHAPVLLFRAYAIALPMFVLGYVASRSYWHGCELRSSVLFVVINSVRRSWTSMSLVAERLSLCGDTSHWRIEHCLGFLPVDLSLVLKQRRVVSTSYTLYLFLTNEISVKAFDEWAHVTMRLLCEPGFGSCVLLRTRELHKACDAVAYAEAPGRCEYRCMCTLDSGWDGRDAFEG